METSCVFCRIVRNEVTPGVVAFRDSHTAVFPSRSQQPRNVGHMQVVPIRHVPQIFDVDGELAGPLMTMVELPVEERIEQARKLSEALRARG